MAELHVQRKETRIWPWIIGVLLLAAIVWFAFGRADTRWGGMSRTSDTMYQTSPTPGSASPPNLSNP